MRTIQHRTNCAFVCIALGAFCCNRGRDELRVTSYLRDGKPDTAAIVAAVEGELDALSKGISNNDADQIFGIFSSTKAVTYVRDGEVAQSIDAARDSYHRSLARLNGKRTFSFESKEFDVLDEKTVLVTGVGVISDAEQKEPWKIAYTILFALEPNGWKALNMHVSWESTK